MDSPTVDPRWQHLDDLDVFGAILQDVLRHWGRSPGQGRGKQSAPQVADSEELMARLVELDRLGRQPFHMELREMAGSLSSAEVARRSGLSKTRCWNLLQGYIKPTMSDMEATARAFGRDPWHFIEYRARWLTDRIHDQLLADPARSEELLRRAALL